MPKVKEMRNSKFLKRGDVGESGVIVTIVNVHQANVAMEGEKPDERWCMAFREFDKPMVLNTTNAQLCEKFLGSDDTDDWLGKQIVLYDEPNVSFGGKFVGGIRVKRAGPPAQAPRSPVRPVAPPAPDDGVPWPTE